MWHQKAKGPPDGPPIFLIFVEKLNCPQSQAYQSISPVGTGLSLTDRALEVSLGTSIGNYSPLIAPQPVKLKIHRWQHRTGSSPVTGTMWTEVEIWNSKMRHPNFGLFSTTAFHINKLVYLSDDTPILPPITFMLGSFILLIFLMFSLSQELILFCDCRVVPICFCTCPGRPF